MQPRLFSQIFLLLLSFECTNSQVVDDKFIKVKDEYTFALVPKSMGNPFFDPAGEGCTYMARVLTEESGGRKMIKCLYTGPQADEVDGIYQAAVLDELISNGNIDGIAVAVSNLEEITPKILKATEAGIPVVTFDTDAPDSTRSAYVGTNNRSFGQQIAKVLKQLVPSGGTFGVLSSVAANVMERMEGFREEITKDNEKAPSRKWVEIEGSPSFKNDGNTSIAMEEMQQMANKNPTAIAPMMGLPMRSGAWEEFVDLNRDRNITIVSGDGMPNQLNALSRRRVHGLVAQLPYEMGCTSIQLLYQLVSHGYVREEIVGTNVITHILVPLTLPQLIVDHNLIGNLQYVGYILFAMISLSALSFILWTLVNRNIQVVKVAQPFFLIMIGVGIFIMGCSLIPLSFDDSGAPEEQREARSVGICMSIPWLASTGFTMTFSALFSKTMRVNKLFHAKVSFARMQVKEREVLIPFAFLLSLNFICLICWTVLDPLRYVRTDYAGTDDWNRIISTYGSCRSDQPFRYLLPLTLINFSALILANWQAYEAREIQSEFSESKYIAIANASFLQALLTGIPMLFVVRNIPEAFYLVLTFTLFVICIAVLMLIFIPKIIMKDNYENEERRRLTNSTPNIPKLCQNKRNLISSLYDPNHVSEMGQSSGIPRELEMMVDSSGMINDTPILGIDTTITTDDDQGRRSPIQDH